MKKKLSLREALEKALGNRECFLTPEQERRTDDAAIQLAHRLYESNREMYSFFRYKIITS